MHSSFIHLLLLTIFGRLKIARLTLPRRAMYRSPAKMLTARSAWSICSNFSVLDDHEWWDFNLHLLKSERFTSFTVQNNTEHKQLFKTKPDLLFKTSFTSNWILSIRFLRSGLLVYFWIAVCTLLLISFFVWNKR